MCFTRDPATGEQGLYGEFLPNAQGEDVVAGIRTPLPLEQMRDILPEAFEQLIETMATLERHYRDVQDIEFTVEDGRLFLLQTRSAKRTAAAALKAAVAMVEEGLITREEAVARIDPTSLDQLLHPRIDPEREARSRGEGAQRFSRRSDRRSRVRRGHRGGARGSRRGGRSSSAGRRPPTTSTG